MSELTPNKYRGSLTIIFQIFSTIGNLSITYICFVVIPLFGWRAFLMMTVIPSICITATLFWVPESPRFLLLKNKKTECLQVINQIAKMNNSKPVHDVFERSFPESSFRDLIHRNYLSTAVFLSITFFVIGLTTYCCLMIFTFVSVIPHPCLQNMSLISEPHKDYDKTIDISCCFEMTWTTYKDFLISAISNLVILPFSFIFINTIGRKLTIALFSFIIALLIILLNLCMGSVWVSVVIFCIRGFGNCNFVLMFIYASEVFPTSVRGLGLGLGGTCIRMGAVFAPLIVRIVMIKFSFLAGTVILCFLNLFSVFLCFLMPYETKNRRMYQTACEEEIPLNYTNNNNNNYLINKCC